MIPSARAAVAGAQVVSAEMRELLDEMAVSARQVDLRAADLQVRTVVAASSWPGQQMKYYGAVAGHAKPLLIGGNYELVVGYDSSTGQIYPGSHGELPFPLPERIGVILYGQSNAIGVFANPVLTTAAVYSHLTFGSGGSSGEPANGWGAVQTSPGTTTSRALHEDTTDDTADAGSDEGESPASSVARSYTDTAVAREGIDPGDRILFVSNASRSGYAANLLDEGSTWYFQIASHIRQAFALAAAAGKTYALRCIVFIHGEADALADSDGSTYRGLIEDGILAPINALVQSLGQTDPVIMVLSQATYSATANRYGEVAKAQLAMARENPLIKIACGNAQRSRYSDYLHFDNHGASEHGGDMGRAVYAVLAGEEPKSTQLLTAQYLGGNQLLLTFQVPVAPLQFNSTMFGAVSQKGIHLFDPGDVANALSSFAVQADGISILCTTARDPLAGAYVDISLRDLVSGQSNRGTVTEVCDSDPATFDTDGLGTLRPLLNFCLADRVLIT